MKKFSAFDLGMIIAFVVVALLGGGAWYYLSGRLSDAQAAATSASSSLNNSTSKGYFPSIANEKLLTADNAAIQAQLDPAIKATFQAPGNKLDAVQSVNPVDWKRGLDTRVSALNALAKSHGVAVPANFYYGFSRYLNQQPGDAETQVLGKQLLGIEQIATILIDAPVKSIHSVQRTYEEDGASAAAPTPGVKGDPDQLGGSALQAPNGLYTSYPFQVDFVVTTEGFRRVIDALMKSPYVFVIRSLTLENTQQDSPKISDLDRMAGVTPGAPPPSLDTPGATAAATSPAVGPQYLFGAETIRVNARIDLIEWHGLDQAEASAAAASSAPANGRRGRSGP